LDMSVVWKMWCYYSIILHYSIILPVSDVVALQLICFTCE